MKSPNLILLDLFISRNKLYIYIPELFEMNECRRFSRLIPKFPPPLSLSYIHAAQPTQFQF